MTCPGNAPTIADANCVVEVARLWEESEACKAKIRDAAIPFAIPAIDDLPQRLESVLSVIYLQRGQLADYSAAHAARGELLRRVGCPVDAIAALECASELTQHPSERRFLAGKLQNLASDQKHA